MSATPKRGAVVLIVMNGDYGKPRPAVVVQADAINGMVDSIIVCPMTSKLIEAPLFRIRIFPDAANGLEKTTEIMTDKIISLHHSRIRQQIGQLDEDTIMRLNRSLALVMGLAG